MTDRELLGRYVAAQDHDAFAELVRRHVRMVYASARRQVGDVADDIVQAVFILLAQKAHRLSRRVALAGWLYRTTQFCCANVRRAEQRRRRHEQRAGVVAMAAQPPSQGWQELMPLLDQALARLGAREREAVLQRHLAGKSIEQTGRELGISPDAAAKRAARGLEKLRQYFAGQGYAVPGTAVSGLMAAEAAREVPAATVAAAAAMAVKATGGSVAVAGIVDGAVRMMVWAKLKSAASVSALVLALAGTAGVGLLAARDAHRNAAVAAGPGPAAPPPQPAGLAAGIPATGPASQQAARLLPGSAPMVSRNGFWPPAPDAPHVQFLLAFGADGRIASAAGGNPGGARPSPGSKAGNIAIYNPYGLELWNGRIYLCDLRRRAVVILDARGQQPPAVLPPPAGGGMVAPTDIAIAEDGTKYVADMGWARPTVPTARAHPRLRTQRPSPAAILVYDAADKPAGRFPAPGPRPSGLAVHGNELYVCDLARHQLQVLDRRTGQVLRAIGTPGDDLGLIWPLGVAVDRTGGVYVGDTLTCRLQRFDARGNLTLRFGDISNQLGGFVRPKQVCVDSEGIIYVVDAAFQNVQMFNPRGRLLTFFGLAGAHPGAMDLPAGICVSEDVAPFSAYVHPAFEAQRIVLVSNRLGTNRVAVYAVGHLRQDHSVADLTAAR